MDIKLENEKNNMLDQKWREKAANELNEISIEFSNARIKQLRHMLVTTTTTTARTTTTTKTTNTSSTTKPFIFYGRQDDAFLLRFLRAKKFDVEKAFKMITKYYSMKEQSPDLFKVSPASQLHDLLKMQIQYMVPPRDANGRKLYIFRVKKCDPNKSPVDIVFRTNVLALENAVREPETQIGGLIVLLDMAGAGLGHAKFLAPYLAKKTVEVIQEAFPLRFKAFHILHEPFYFDAILTVLKPFLKDKIRRRIHLHGSNLSSLHEYISLDILPEEYGGKLPKFDNTHWRKSLMDDENYFQRLETFNHLNNLLEDSGIVLENDNELFDEINGNILENENNKNDKENTMKKASTTKKECDSVVDDNTKIPTSSTIVSDAKGNSKLKIDLDSNTFDNASDENSDDSYEYKLCEDYSPSDFNEKEINNGNSFKVCDKLENMKV